MKTLDEKLTETTTTYSQRKTNLDVCFNKQVFVTGDETGSPKSPLSPMRLCEVTGSVTSTGIDEKNPKPNKEQNSDDAVKESVLAERIAEGLRDSLCYDEAGNDWYTQSNGLWRVITEKRALKSIMKALNAELPDGYAISKLNNIKAFLTIHLLTNGWEGNRYLLPMLNGVLDTQTMQLSRYSHAHRFNWQLPYNFNADTKFVVIKRWLWEATGQDLESVNIIRAFFKIALVGGDVQKFLELIGAGGTGKSTLTRLLIALISEKNHVTTDLKNLETNRFETAAFYGKRLIIINDSSRYGGEVSTLKALTGGDTIRLEKKNQQQSGGFVFGGVVVVASNEAIQTADYTSGLIRRRMPVNFNRLTTDADKAKWAALGGIEAVMHNELPGMLNWVLAMTESEVKAVLGGINGQLNQVQRNHLVDTNKIAAWIDDNIVIDADSVVYVGCSMKTKTEGEAIQARREKLYANYEAWCDDGAVHPVALQRFTANIIDVCNQLKIDVTEKKKDRHGKPIKGIAIRTDRHFNFATPVTQKLLGAYGLPTGDEAVTQQTLDNDHGDLNDQVFLPQKNPVDNVEYF